jgi:hypothetical protein
VNVASPPAGELTFATPGTRASLSRLQKSGRALRLAPGIYVVDATLPPEAVAWQHWLAIAAHIWPGAVICGRSALSGSRPVNGAIYLAHPEPRRRDELRLPSLTLRVQDGPGELPGDMSMPSGLWLSGDARGLVENVNVAGRPPRSRAGTTAVEDRINEIARTGGAGAISRVLAQLDVIAPYFDPAAVEAVRTRLAAVLGTFTDVRPRSVGFAARLAGAPFDEHRLVMLRGLTAVLGHRAPTPRHARPSDPRWAWLPFFEAYFSNFIEGTEFGVVEARAIAVDGVVPTARPQDAHDVRATYRLASDPSDATAVPRTPGEFVDLLRTRHGALMAARPDKRPGELKAQDNYAGGYRFVDHELVEGTLREGFLALNEVTDAFARAVAMMLLVTEVHPFDDGNGRVARLAANAELSAAGQVRFVVPTVYRNNYLAGLAGVSNRAGRGESLIAVLDFAQRWTAAVDWRTFDTAHADVEASNGYLDPALADSAGQVLRMPARPGEA